MRVKIFTSSNHADLEKQVNVFLDTIGDPVSVTATESNGFRTIVVF